MALPTLGGTLITRDCIRLDYCFEEAIRSLLPVVDEMIVLDCGSTDGTLERLREIEAEGNGLVVFQDGPWGIAPDYHRLSVLYNIASGFLRADWQFMIQADEVLHESSREVIRDTIHGEKRSIFVRRLNLFGGVDRMLRLDIPYGDHPCGREICRLAPRDTPAYSDAENLDSNKYPADRTLVDRIVLFHYGYVRRDENHIEKTIEMQSWFHGPNSSVDPRVLAMRGGRYEWERMKPAEMLCGLPMAHPMAAMPWVERRRSEENAK
jgi:glycosyltransferase involved in cell wall biosynthesis